VDAGQHIRFAMARDGVRIAYATSGSGPPLVKAANWLSHIEFDWDSPVWRHWLRDLSARRTLIRYDERGCGLSDRDARDLSFGSWVSDLETVVDAAGVQRFPLLGVSQGAAVAIAYAACHPARVSHLVLYGAYGRGRLVRDPSPRQLEECQTMLKLIEIGWGRESEAFRQVFTAQFIPGGSIEQLHWFNELQRMSTSPANAARFLSEFDRIDVMATAARVRCPTVVLHARGDERVPFDEGRLLAAQIPGAQFVPLDSHNHVLLAEPAWDTFTGVVSEFIGASSSAAGVETLGDLTTREHELLELIARGLDNGAIAERLGLQVKTVRNHITHIFDKLGVRTRAEAIVKAREAGLGSRAES
jgi:pimeloyl-ACP methyl ester carboxylesterase/DNA-binding CsgD family transcriptional regulator